MSDPQMAGGDFTAGRRHATAPDVEPWLWLAAGAAWAVVALQAWGQTRRLEARRRTLNVSDRLLRQVFPNGLRT